MKVVIIEIGKQGKDGKRRNPRLKVVIIGIGKQLLNEGYRGREVFVLATEK